MSPEKSLVFTLGYDLASQDASRTAIQRMRTTAAPALAGALQAPDGTQAQLVFSPIMLPVFDEQAKAYFLYLRGFAFALLHPAEILARAIPTGTVDNIVITLSPAGEVPTADQGEPHFVDTVYVANEPWSFRCAAQPGYLAHRRSRQPATLVASGAIIAALLAFQVYHLASRARRTDLIVQQRTAQLRDEMAGRKKLQEEILNISSREQQRLGRDLHDSLGQKLAGAVYLSKALADQTPDAAHLNEVLKESVAQVRLIARGLSPVAVGEDGLPNALRRLADETTEIFSVACSFKTDVSSPFSAAENVATHLYQIAQEAVNNAIRHGHARDITIRLTANTLSIENNGTGFDATAEARSSGMGLQIMRYRAEIMGGSLDIKSAAGGTTIVCRFAPVRG
jgi:signal transduction histidine kinase